MSLRSPFLPQSEVEAQGEGEYEHVAAAIDDDLEGHDFEDFDHDDERDWSEFEEWVEETHRNEPWSPFAESDEQIDDEATEPGSGYSDAEDAEVEDEELFEAELYVSSLSMLEAEDGESVTFPSGASLRAIAGADGARQEHWDPNGTGNPLLDASSRSTKLSPNFTVDELTKSGGRRFTVARIDPRLVECVQAIRDRVGRPVVVTSGYRSWGHNENIYDKRDKKPTLSRHCSGQAVDIRISGMDGMAIAKAAIDACGADIGVGIGSKYAHVDVRGTWARWTYFSGSKNRSAVREIDDYAKSRIGPSTPTTLVRPSPAPTSAIDVRHAVVRNRVHSQQLGWGPHRRAISRLIGFTDSTPDESGFADALARWQATRGLEVDGILGPGTWRAMRADLGLEAGPSPAGRLTRKKLGYAGYGGGRLDAAIRRLMAAGRLPEVSERDIDTLQRIASIESRGQASAINTWDSAVVSAGFKQWTLHYGALQDLIRRASDAFARHGIRVDSIATYQITKEPVPAIVGVPDYKQLRSAEWSQRFFDASLEDDALVAAVKKGLEDIRQLESRVRSKWGWSEHLGSPKGRALLVQLANNRPAWVKYVIPRVLSRSGSADEARFLQIFVSEIIAEYDRQRGEGQKARGWTARIMGG